MVATTVAAIRISCVGTRHGACRVARASSARGLSASSPGPFLVRAPRLAASASAKQPAPAPAPTRAPPARLSLGLPVPATLAGALRIDAAAAAVAAVLVTVPLPALAELESEYEVPITDYLIGILFGAAVLGLLVLTVGTLFLSLKSRADEEEEKKAIEQQKMEALRYADERSLKAAEPKKKKTSLTTGAAGFAKKGEENKS